MLPIAKRQRVAVATTTAAADAVAVAEVPVAIVPKVVLKLRYPPAEVVLSPAAQPRAASVAVADVAHLWPSGNNWMPKTTNWGTRSTDAFGCGKCRWRPTGCRGCIAAAAHYQPRTLPPLLSGVPAIPPRGVDEDFDREDEDKAGARERQSRLAALQRRVCVTSDGVQDPDGSGVVALKSIAKGEVLVDPSVIFVTRPSEYAQAHLPQYHALELGNMGYFRLREPAFGHASLTFFVNEAQHLGRDGPEPNMRYKVVRPRDGGTFLGLEALADVAPGTELLCRYNQKL